MQNCSLFECKMMFKCPRYYCIPWKYVCDGKWDCPHGYDESDVQYCSSAVKCKNMFKCRHSTICIHVGDVCNGNKDCIEADDEQFCSLKGQLCPSKCQCFTYVLRCIGVYTSGESKDKFPYYNLMFINCAKNVVDNLLLRSVKIKFLKINHNNIQNICNLSLTETIILDGAWNKITSITTACFSKANLLSITNLSSNNIIKIGSNSFSNLISLKYVDLSNNFLLDIPPEAFTGSCNLIVISLLNNSLSSVSDNTFQTTELEQLLAEDFSICCVLPHKTKCLTRISGAKSCPNILPNIFFKVIFYCISFTIIILNIVSLIYKNNRTGSFHTIVKYVNTCDLLHGIHASIIWAADLIYRSTFALREDKWRSHPMCFLFCFLTLNLSLFSPCILSFMSICRLHVVTHPIISKLKQLKVVQKYIFCIFCVTTVLSSNLSYLTHYLYGAVPFRLCSPFVDQTKIYF